MAGLLGDVLPYIYQRANALKRGIGDFVADPVGSITQGVNYANDRAGGLLAATRAAADESAASGGLVYGPANQKLAGILANAYNPMGITVYHGSPHKFAKFDSSKIGTGEGAQAYGHGLYLAESPDVAKSYSGKLSSELTYNGRPMARESGRSSKDAAAWSLYLSGGDKDAAKASGLASDKWIDKLDPAKLQPGGQVYKVDLPDEAVARMLDWDKPLSQQAPEVQRALGFQPGTRAELDAAAEKLFTKYGTPNKRTPAQQKAFMSEYNALNDALDKLAPDTLASHFYNGTDPDNWLHGAFDKTSKAQTSEELRKLGIRLPRRGIAADHP